MTVLINFKLLQYNKKLINSQIVTNFILYLITINKQFIFYLILKYTKIFQPKIYQMKRTDPNDQILDLQWEDDLQDIIDIDIDPFRKQFFQYRDDETSKEKNNKYDLKNTADFMIKQEISSQSSSAELNNLSGKRQLHQNTSYKMPHDTRNEKQQIYSKVYRQRKKQKFRQLQEQNSYLKKRISELQSLLRQQQIQLNRFKFPPPQKELSIQQFSKQFVDMSVNVLQKMKLQPSQYHKQYYGDQNYLTKFFLESYDERGFAGRKKIKILNYHFNEILELLMTDTEKYLSLLYGHAKSYDQLQPIPQFELINKTYLQIYKPEGNLWSRLKVFNKFLKPISLQLNTHISQFYRKYEDILCCSNRIHAFLKQTYLNNNMDVARRRMEMQSWFNFYKYGKLMRKLRFKWFEWMKNLTQEQQQQKRNKSKKSVKKKKLSQ